MSALNSIALLVHILSIIGVMVLLLMQINKTSRKIPAGTFHAAVTALVAGVVMVAIRSNLHDKNPEKWPLLDHGWLATKLGILLVILVLLYKNYKKAAIRSSVWFALVGLTTLNILIALFW